MDAYTRFLYLSNEALRTMEVGDLTLRIQTRQRLKCKNFKWYLKNVMPQKFVFDEHSIVSLMFFIRLFIKMMIFLDYEELLSVATFYINFL